MFGLGFVERRQDEIGGKWKRERESNVKREKIAAALNFNRTDSNTQNTDQNNKSDIIYHTQIERKHGKFIELTFKIHLIRSLQYISIEAQDPCK